MEQRKQQGIFQRIREISIRNLLIILTVSTTLTLGVVSVLILASTRHKSHTADSSLYSHGSSIQRLIQSSQSQSDQILDFNKPESLLSKILIPRPVGSQNLSLCRSIFVDHFNRISSRIIIPSPQRDMGSENSDSNIIRLDLPSNSTSGRNISSHHKDSVSHLSHEFSTWKLQEHSFTDQTPLGPRKFTSQIFTHDPQASHRVILSAHIDSKILGDDPDRNSFIGATDSAAPVAIILSIVKALSPILDRKLLVESQGMKSDDDDRLTLQVVLLDGEEAFKEWSPTDSIYGARALAEEWSKPISQGSRSKEMKENEKMMRSIDQIKSFILLDLIGSNDTVITNHFQNTGDLYDLWQAAEERMLRETGSHPISSSGNNGTITGRKSFFVKRNSQSETFSQPIEDDHLPFQKEGVPILHLISSPFPTVWHQNSDDRTALDLRVLREWSMLGQIAMIEYLQLEKYL
ncbi:glutaminyl-peptide cyclotransferase [Phakopsora pachyrhizi]|uniref:Peptide hydrolase n=1 Tax=Phakopsora pachyrhizi TaxID=170000 RepID=A0AAV0BGW2_PHAPC|nr:glutaminyl-peptide cyclotransferase [Phakopsora pachyrhizi]CAH7686205.1 glutaminyl-peptide cyclotransferase [Phakopsora pachyrhizi]